MATQVQNQRLFSQGLNEAEARDLLAKEPILLADLEEENPELPPTPIQITLFTL